MTKEKTWIIYMYTFPNGKRYIGKTSRTIKERQASSDWVGYCESTILKRAIDKYGTDDVVQEILFKNKMTDEYASRLEQICILLFKANCLRFSQPSYGYNMTDGGEGVCGYQHTESAKIRMSEAKKGKIGKDANSSKPVYCIELERTFVNAVEAEKYTNISRKTISLCCLGKHKSTRGGNTNFSTLHWIFKNDKTTETINQVIHTPIIAFPTNVNSGVNGVSWDKSKKKWSAYIAYKKRRYFLGRYMDKKDAIVARLTAEKQFYGDMAPQAKLFIEYNIK